MIDRQDWKQDYDRLGPWTTRFRLHGQNIGGSYEVSEDDPLLRAFIDRAPMARRVLELGCMEGGRTFPLARRAGHVVGVDARREHLQRARFIERELGITNTLFLEQDLENSDLAALGTCDVIFNVGLLYHLSDPARLLQQCAEVAPEMLLWTHVVDDADAEHRGYRGRFTTENPTDRVGGLRSRSFRPERSELVRMLDDCGWRDLEWLKDDATSLTLWCRTTIGPRPQVSVQLVPTLAVIITAHNYGHYLDECLESVIRQSRRPDKIVVVDDASTDNTTDVIARWADRGVRYLRVDHHDPRQSRSSGLQATSAEFVCFLDADDRLAPDYLRGGLAGFDRHDVGIVYSDVDYFGDWNRCHQEPEEITLADMGKLNYVHNGSIVRREALEMSRALEVPCDSLCSHEDWLAWRKILEQGWKARKQRGIYGYRRHEANRTNSKYKIANYFNQRAMETETITLFVALSGRSAVWPRFQQFLEQQTWPHSQVKLWLLDTSQDARFGRRIRRWISQCDYADVRYRTEAVAIPGLADAPRDNGATLDAVRMAAARIYNRLAREVTGYYVLTLEDDVIPPNDVIEKLLRGFDHHVASVAAPYPSRFHKGYVAWKEGRQIIEERPQPEAIVDEDGEPCLRYDLVEGNGFGCTLFRGDVFRDAVFTARQQPYVDFDPAFYERLKATGLQAKVCWDAECEHLENDTRPIMTWDHWPESWETTDLSDYRAGFLKGRDACQWIVDTLNGPEPAAIWGLSDGDVAWWCYDGLVRIPGVDRRWLDALALTSGLHPEDRDELWPLFDEACRNAPHWLVQYNWDIAERFSRAALAAHGITIDSEGFGYARSRKRKVDCNAVYKLLDEDLWWLLLEGKQLAIVSGHADELATRILDEAFVRASGGSDVTWSVAAKVQCPDKSVPKRRHRQRIEDELFSADWDLLLCSAGSLSAILCEHTRQAGRKAIDIGALDVQLTKD
ncbi:glycosyltransferase [Thalassoglobus sp.]|uniref:glycosyltransferase n=1 Tax=Thalassoglobus sp. TaxID=2795869 RepID=UPI003AA93B85